MCFNTPVIKNAAARNVLTIDEIERIARNFKGLHQVNFSGGEPFLRPDFKDVPGLFYKYSGTRMFTIPTNSSLPERSEEAIRTICDQCPDAWVRITQSLDGVGNLHDEIRGFSGLFERVVDLNSRLTRLRREYPQLSNGIAMVLSSFNRGHEYELLDYVCANLSFDDFGPLFVRGDTQDPQARLVEAEAYRDFSRACLDRCRARSPIRGLTGRAFTAINYTALALLNTVIMEDRFVTPCRAGRNMVVMNDEGLIEPCEILGYYIRQGKADIPSSVCGNIRDFDYDIRRVLATKAATRITEHIIESNCYCTFECAMAVNVLYTPRLWLRVLRNFFRL